ncbi:nucleoside 2-deoxyribosyltransferase [Chryseomicrobium aureum]|uniref:nucleoside 2-deoxyribosyltransferase n=1 Tax=Chryseomicrobium aureum TaxID=1441723 RepID=UPI00370D7F7C
MKFYIASSFKNIEEVRNLSNELKLRGHIHSYDWTQNERANSIEKLATIGELEKAAVIESDFVVILLPGGKGTHIELGIAIGLGKRVYLYSPTDEIYDYDKTSTFYHIQGVEKFVGTDDAFVQYLVEVCNEESMDLT